VPDPVLSGGEFTLTFTDFIKAVLLGLGSVSIWLLKKLGDKQVTTLQEIRVKQIEIDQRLAILEDRESRGY
jgi:hypothetical protein